MPFIIVTSPLATKLEFTAYLRVTSAPCAVERRCATDLASACDAPSQPTRHRPMASTWRSPKNVPRQARFDPTQPLHDCVLRLKQRDAVAGHLERVETIAH